MRAFSLCSVAMRGHAKKTTNTTLQYFTTKLALSTQYPQWHKDKLRKQLKQLLQQVTTLRQDIASSRPKVACRETTFTTLRLAYKLKQFQQGHCPAKRCFLLFTLQRACNTRSVCFVPAKRCISL